MKKVLLSIVLLIACFTVVGVVYALTIPAPTITGVDYPDATSLKINYNPNNTNSNYKILLYNTTSGALVKKDITTRSHTFTGLETGKVYNFKARVYYVEGNKTYKSEWSNIVSATPKVGDATISSITTGNKKATVKYSLKGTANGVEIYVKELKKSYKTTNLTTYTLTGLTNGKKYTIAVRAYLNNGLTGAWSATKTVKIPGFQPATVKITKIIVGNGKATIKYKTNYNKSNKPRGVEVYIPGKRKTPYRVKKYTHYTINNLTNGKKYNIKIRAYYSSNKHGKWSTTKTIKMYSWSEIIARTAEKLAWPKNTSSSIYHHHYAHNCGIHSWSGLGKARPTKEFQVAFDKVKPSHWNQSNCWHRFGADCGYYVTVVLRYSNHDRQKPFDLFESYFSKNSNWYKVSKAKRGDVCYKKSGAFHTRIYLGNGYSAEAGYYGQNFGHVAHVGCSGYTIVRAR